jgi:heme/copper-type cytochrome/quinol oxidase subunit 2
MGKLTGGMSAMSGMEGMEGMEGMGAAKAVGGVMGIFMFIIMLIFAVIYFFPLLYLLRFSTYTKNAIANLDGNLLTLGLKNLKMYWKYIGILIIVVISLYILLLIFGIGLAGALT